MGPLTVQTDDRRPDPVALAEAAHAEAVARFEGWMRTEFTESLTQIFTLEKLAGLSERAAQAKQRDA